MFGLAGAPSWQTQKERKEQREAKARLRIQADLEGNKKELDETLARLRKRPHAQLLGLDDTVLIDMRTQLRHNEARMTGAEQRIKLAKEKKAAALRSDKLSEWASEGALGGRKSGLQDLKRDCIRLKKELRGRPKEGMKWSKDKLEEAGGAWERDPSAGADEAEARLRAELGKISRKSVKALKARAKEAGVIEDVLDESAGDDVKEAVIDLVVRKTLETDSAGIDDDSAAQALIEQAKAVAASSPQTSLLLYKAAAFYYTASGQERPKLFQRIADMETSVSKLKDAGLLKELGIVEMDEGEGEDEGEGSDADAEERALAHREEILATDPRSALQCAKDRWQLTKAGWRSRNSLQKKIEIEDYQANAKLAIASTAKRRAFAKLHSEVSVMDPGASAESAWEKLDEKSQDKRLEEAEETVNADRRRNAEGSAALADALKGSGKKNGAAKLVNKILAHHAKLRSILDEIKEDGSSRDGIESKVCGDLLECDDTYLKIVAMQHGHAKQTIAKQMKALEEKSQYTSAIPTAGRSPGMFLREIACGCRR